MAGKNLPGVHLQHSRSVNRGVSLHGFNESNVIDMLGKMRKKVWITAGDIVLVAKRDFQDEKVDIVHKYTADEARNLKQYGELPETARINETAVDMAMTADDDDNDIGIDFDDL